jgi:isopentenyl-diphosphate delta-isomerase
VENEICPVFAARITNDVTINEDEVMDYQWVELDALFRALDATPWALAVDGHGSDDRPRKTHKLAQ